MKFVFVGDIGTGKTSLLEQYINNKFSIALNPTVSFITLYFNYNVINVHASIDSSRFQIYRVDLLQY